jgi:two-component system, chemotaxis family, chemotaxis protein CheY
MKIVMIADDSPVIRKVARRLLEDVGFVVVEAADGGQAISMCRENMPDIVIVDWDMPDRSGVEIIGEIARLHGAANTRFVYCTSEIMIPEMTRAKRAGATSFLMKPFNRNILLQKLSEAGISEVEADAA